jgi:uncharacterized membrane protein YcfT
MAMLKQRVNWVDYAKGICIVLVVAMHSTLGVEKAAGEISSLHGFIDWAKPFRMPDFFMISGLFLASRISKPWRIYLDTKFVHFAYFYVLWMSIQFLTKGFDIYRSSGATGVLHDYALGFVQPFGTLWFIYMLAVFFVVTKALLKVSPLLVFAVAALLEMAHFETGYFAIDEFASRYVYFFVGYWLAKDIFGFAEDVNRKSAFHIFAGLLVWGVGNFIMVKAGLASMPGVSLPLGLMGAGAVISAGVLLSKFRAAGALRYLGQNSIVVYLAFFLFMAVARIMVLRYLPGLNIAVVALISTSAGVVGPVLLDRVTRNTKFEFLFKRPVWARLANAPKQWHSGPHVTNKFTKSKPAFEPQTR